MVNINGVVSHDEKRRIEKKAIPTGMETRNSTSMTRRGLGSREWAPPRDMTPAESGRGAMTDVPACNAVDRREMKIEPAPPGRPKQKYGKCERGVLLRYEEAHTAKGDCENCIAFVAAHESIEHSARRGGDDHRTEKRGPACAEQLPDVLVSPDDSNRREGAKGDGRNDDVGSRGANAEGEDCRHRT